MCFANSALININIDLSIKFKDGVVESDYIHPIKLSIKDYIEGCNDSSSSSHGVNDVRISALITGTSNNFNL